MGLGNGEVRSLLDNCCRVAGRVITGVLLAAAGDRGGVGNRTRSIAGNVDCQSNIRIAGQGGQNITAGAGNRRTQDACPPCAAGGGGGQFSRQGVCYGYRSISILAAGILNGDHIGGAGLTLGEVAGMGLGYGQVWCAAARKLEIRNAGVPVERAISFFIFGGVPEGAVVTGINLHGAVVAPSTKSAGL